MSVRSRHTSSRARKAAPALPALAAAARTDPGAALAMARACRPETAAAIAAVWQEPPAPAATFDTQKLAILAVALHQFKPAWGPAWAEAGLAQTGPRQATRRALLAPLAAQIAPSKVLTEATWAQADGALARALADAALLDEAVARLMRAARKAPAVLPAAETVEAEALAMRQAVDAAAAARGISLFSAPGDIAAFDAARHEPNTGHRLAEGEAVRVVSPGVTRGEGAAAHIVLRAGVRRISGRQAAKGRPE